MNWDHVSIVLGLAAILSLVIDGMQTHAIATSNGKYVEIGFAKHFLGRNPNPAAVVLYFGVWIVIVTLLAIGLRMFYPWGPSLVFAITLGFQLPALRQNYRLFGGRVLPK